MKELEILEMDNNESQARGVVENEDGTFTAMTFTRAKEFKTRNGAENWYKRRTER